MRNTILFNRDSNSKTKLYFKETEVEYRMMNKSSSSPFLMKWKKKIQYLSDYCSLQVLGYVITLNSVPLFQRIFWLVTIIASCVCSVRVFRGSLINYTSDAVSYSVETNYLEFDTPFPAVTICDFWTESHKKIVEKYFNVTSVSKGLVDFTNDVSFWNPKFCSKCSECEIGRTCLANFTDLVKFVRKTCVELLVKCSWNNEPFSCCDRFLPIETEYGTCFVFNSYLIGNEPTYSVNRTIGLPTLEFEATAKVMIRIHSPGEMLSVASDKVLSRCDELPFVSDMSLTLSAEQTVSDISVQRLSPSSRDCLFEHEQPANARFWPFKQYSYGACLLYCRAIAQANICNCTHHFMSKIGSFPKCGIDGLICLQENNLAVVDKCYCPMSCNEVLYKVVHVTCPRISKKQLDEDRRDTRGRIRLGYLPTLRVRRQAIRELLGLVVDVGGVIGVFFGASLLSFIEIYYLLFIRKYN